MLWFQAQRSTLSSVQDNPLITAPSNCEVGRLDGDPLYNAQDIKITDFMISPPETAGGETWVTVRFKNLGKPARIVYLLTHQGDGWKISDIRYDDGSSLKKILQSDR